MNDTTITASHESVRSTTGTVWTSSESTTNTEPAAWINSDSTTNTARGAWVWGVNIESPEVTKLKTRIDVLEKELLFIKSSLMGDEDGKNSDLYFRKIDFK